jgi:exosome complex exonuclease DIS3/RRP44
MLLANIAVGRRITEAFPRCALLRRHPSPPIASYEQLQAAAKSVGVTLRVGTSKELADSLDDAVDPSRPFMNRLLRILATRCMMQATYFCSGELAPAEYRHYGLATEIYTHFTSPIRR